MRIAIRTAILFAAMAVASGSACGMSRQTAQSDHCRVIGGDKLPTGLGGSGVICEAIELAVRKQAPGASYTAEVRALSPSSLAAVVSLGDGRTLAEQKMAVSDRQLNRRSIDRFAATIAAEIAKAIRQ